MSRSVTVLGAGIVGICCALYLQRDGHHVTLVDRGEPGKGTSYGNAGILSPASCVPMALPGVLSKLPGWLLDPMGPVAVRMAHLPAMLPWFLHFRRATRIENVEANADALRRLLTQTFDAYAPLVKAAGGEGLIQRPGYLVVYESDAAFESDRLAWKIRRDRGVEFDVLDGPGLRAMEPALSTIYTRGVYLLDQGYVTSPLRLAQSLAARFERDGGRIERAHVRDIEIGAQGPSALRTEAGRIPVQSLVVAAGVLLFLTFAVPPAVLRFFEREVVDLGVILLTAGVMLPFATGQVGLRGAAASLLTPSGLVAVVVGAASAYLGARGVALLQSQPSVIIGLLAGAILGTTVFQGIPVGPLVQAGLLSIAYQLLRMER